LALRLNEGSGRTANAPHSLPTLDRHGFRLNKIRKAEQRRDNRGSGGGSVFGQVALAHLPQDLNILTGHQIKGELDHCINAKAMRRLACSKIVENYLGLLPKRGRNLSTRPHGHLSRDKDQFGSRGNLSRMHVSDRQRMNCAGIQVRDHA
jgi:hypothetical protein